MLLTRVIARRATIMQAIARTVIEAETPEQLFSPNMCELYELRHWEMREAAKNRLKTLRSLL